MEPQWKEWPILDVQLCREDDGTMSTAVNRKPTHTNQYLSYYKSHHPTAHKAAVVRTLMTRAEQLSSLGVEQAEEEKHVLMSSHPLACLFGELLSNLL